MKKIFVCSPYRGNIEKNLENVKTYCKYAGLDGIPIAPHLYFTQFLNEATHRWRGISWGLELLKDCDAVYVFADEVSEGMIAEIRLAKERKIPIFFFNSERKKIDPETFLFNDTIGIGYKQMIEEVLNPVDPTCICPHANECRALMEFFRQNRKGNKR